MEKAKIKVFTCPIHQNIPIVKICTELECNNPLCCVDCILDEKCSHLPHRKSLLSLENYVDHVANEYKGLQRLNLGQNGPPKEFEDYISEIDESLQNLCRHVEEEKILLEQSLNDILEKFKEICSKVKASAFASLDEQVNNFKINIDSYKSKLQKFYGTKSKENPIKSDILKKFNDADNTHELTKIINEFQEDFIDRAPTDQNMLNQKLDEVKYKMYTLSQIIEAQSEIRPKLHFLEEEEEDSIFLENFYKTMTQMLANAFNLDNLIPKLTERTEFDSRLLTSNDIKLLNTWMPSKKDRKLKLLYRATRDGFSSHVFREKIGSLTPTMIIIQSEYNKRFGGITDADWSLQSQFKNSRNSFLFSFDEKEIYPIKKSELPYSIYCKDKYSATFGGGPDICICDQSNINKNSWAKVFFSYDSKGKNNLNLGGNEHFTTKEIEVFQLI